MSQGSAEQTAKAGAAEILPEKPSRFKSKHLLDIESLEAKDICALLDRANGLVPDARQGRKLVGGLEGRTLINLFFENSTRTRISFELAGRRLGMDVVNFQTAASSITKGETLIDTALTIDAMAIDAMVIRHRQERTPHEISARVSASVINAGDGTNEHPTQALTDALAIRRNKGSLDGLEVAICGDIAHSRVARSNAQLMTKLGARVRLVGPAELMPEGDYVEGTERYNSLQEGIEGADVVMMLRVQLERMDKSSSPSAEDYFREWGLSAAKLAHAKPDAIVMHPGPINREVEIASNVADHVGRSLILDQVAMGVAVRMAVLQDLLGSD